MSLKIQLRVEDLAKLAAAAPVRRSKVEVIELPIGPTHLCTLFDEFIVLSLIEWFFFLLHSCQDMSAEVVDSNPYSRLMALQRMGIVENYERIRDFSVAIVVCINLLYHSCCCSIKFVICMFLFFSFLFFEYYSVACISKYQRPKCELNYKGMKRYSSPLTWIHINLRSSCP